jgi:hypothetical protein
MLTPLSKVPTTNGQAPATKTVSGQHLAKIKWSARRRARLAAQLAAGEVALVRPCIKQAAVLCRVPLALVQKVRSNANGRRRNGNGGHHVLTLAEHLAHATPEERLEAARSYGIEHLWDEMIAPLVAADRAGE